MPGILSARPSKVMGGRKAGTSTGGAIGGHGVQGHAQGGSRVVCHRWQYVPESLMFTPVLTLVLPETWERTKDRPGSGRPVGR